MARYLCEAGHEAQSYTGADPTCALIRCAASMHTCTWCGQLATAHADVDGDLIHACDYHAEAFDIWAVELPRCAECGDAVIWPTEWLCAPCEHDVAHEVTL
jgi:hypothetical protein